MSQTIKQVLHDLDHDHKMLIQDRRNFGKGFNIIQQPFKKAMLKYDPVNNFSIKLEVTKPGQVTLSVEAAFELMEEMKTVTNIALRLNSSLKF